MLDFFEFSNEMLCVADSRGYFVRLNQAWTKILGWSVEELVSRPYVEFVHPDDTQATRREAELLLSGTHETISFENRYRSKDGSYRWLAWYAKLDSGSNQLVAAARDITEQKLQAEALRESEERFVAFMNNSPAIAWAKDEQGRIVYFNKAYEDRFQIRLAEWRGKTDCDLWPVEIARQFRETDIKVLASGVPVAALQDSQMADGRHASWMSVKFPYRDRYGNHYVGGIGIDITDLKRVEAELTSERQLLRNLIEVQENEKQFLCHEFHDGLIQYAVGSLMLLESCRRHHLPSEDLAVIEKAIDNLRKGIEDGRRTIRGIRPAVLDDDSSLQAAIEDLIQHLAPSEMLVTCKCDSEIGQLPEMIQTTVYRVIQEALNNARKHSGTDVVRIKVRKDGGNLHLEIQDFGRGFDVASARQRGFGLRGMSERVRLLGGECVIESQLDEGTRIVVRLPITATDNES